MAGETPVGGIVGFLRLEADQFHREIGRALTELDLLDGKRVDVDVNVDRTGAASIAATEREVGKLDDSVKRLDRSTRSSRGGVGALATAIITLGPALVPLGAGVVGLGAAFGGMGTAGVLAIVGIKREMEQGTALGYEYKAAIDSAKTGLTQLSTVAAHNVLGSFQAAVADLNARMPELTKQTGDLASITGRAAGALTGGLLSAFQSLEPLIRDVSVYVLDLSTRFRDAMSGPGIVSFGDYVRSVFPQVMQDVEAIVGAVGHLVAAFAPLGLGTLSMLRLLSDLISAIPVDVLSVLATTAASVFLGFRTWQGLSGLVGGLGTTLERLGVQASTAATAVRGLQIAAGVIGIALAGLSLIMSANAEANRANQQAVDDLTDALIQSNGVLDEHVRKVQYDSLVSSGVVDTYKALGGNVRDLTDAALGNAAAQERVNAVLRQAKPAADDFGAAGVVVNGQIVSLTDATGKVSTAILGANGQLVQGKQAAKDYAAATSVATTETNNAATASQWLATQYGTSAGTYDAVVTSQQQIADKAAAATLQMQLENNAAGLLKQSLDLLNGEAVSAAQAQNGFDRAMLAVGQSTRDAKGHIDKAKTALTGNSEAAVTNRSNLLTLATQAGAVAEAFGNQKDSAEAGRAKLVELREQIIKNAVAQGLNKDEVVKWLDQVMKIPKTVPPTKADIDKAAAEAKLKEFQAHIDALRGKTVKITTLHETINYVTKGDVSLQAARNRSAIANLNAKGSLTLANGVRAMAEGGYTGRESRIMRATKPILWNEAPGGEAYISLAPQQRGRSRAIWEETGRILGMGGQSGSGPLDLSRSTVRALGREIAAAMPTPRVALDDISRGLAR